MRLTLALAAVLAAVVAAPCHAETAATPRHPEVERMADQIAGQFPDVPTVTVDQTLTLVEQEEALIVDARSDEERAVSQVPGAVTPDELTAEAAEGKTVIAYCTIGYRASKATQALRKQGYDAQNLRGGILAWVNGLRPLETPAGEPTKRVHVRGSNKNKVPEPYVPVP